mmetsp:Transcript_96727/g.279232  ORF Transcript_96727/g.279232 Transcript_96727/m.279232 type:complete len:274 (+) Transcript_96727:509-1330(+)
MRRLPLRAFFLQTAAVVHALALPLVVFIPLLLLLLLVQYFLLLIQLRALLLATLVLVPHEVFELLRLREAFGLIENIQHFLLELKRLPLLLLSLPHWLHLLLPLLVQHGALRQFLEGRLHLLSLLRARQPFSPALLRHASLLLRGPSPLLGRGRRRPVEEASHGFPLCTGHLGELRAHSGERGGDVFGLRLQGRGGGEVALGLLRSALALPGHPPAEQSLRAQPRADPVPGHLGYRHGLPCDILGLAVLAHLEVHLRQVAIQGHQEVVSLHPP